MDLFPLKTGAILGNRIAVIVAEIVVAAIIVVISGVVVIVIEIAVVTVVVVILSSVVALSASTSSSLNYAFAAIGVTDGIHHYHITFVKDFPQSDALVVVITLSTVTRFLFLIQRQRSKLSGPYLRSFDHLGRSSEAIDRKKKQKVKCDGRTDRRMDRRTDRQSGV